MSLKGVAVIAAVLLFFPSIGLPDGVDVGFNPPKGYVLYGNASVKEASGFAIALTSDGKTLAAGCQTGATGRQAALLVRYRADGKIDRSFGSDGIVLLNRGQRSAFFDLAQTPDGSIVASGAIGNGDVINRNVSSDLLLMMMRHDGTPTASFGTSGVVSIPGNEIGLSVALQRDGMILVAGWTFLNATHDLLVRRFHADGRIDRAFGENGRLALDRGGDDYGTRIAVDPDGCAVVVGRSENGDNVDAIVMRLRPNGRPDSAFGNKGTLVIDLGRDERLEDVAILPDRSIVAVGGIEDGTASKLLVVRLRQDGRFDADFGRNGILDLGRDGRSVKGIALAMGTDRHLFIAGELSEPPALGSIVTRIDGQGVLVERWRLADAAAMPLVRPEFGLAADIAVDPDGRPVVCGWAKCFWPQDRYVSSAIGDREAVGMYLLRLAR